MKEQIGHNLKRLIQINQDKEHEDIHSSSNESSLFPDVILPQEHHRREAIIAQNLTTPTSSKVKLIIPQFDIDKPLAGTNDS